MGDIDDTLEDIKQPITELEIDMLGEFGLATKKNNIIAIDKSEFIILCMVRIGAASPDLIKLVDEYFDELDDDKSGTLTIDEILRKRDGADVITDRMMDRISRQSDLRESLILSQVSENQKKHHAERCTFGGITAGVTSSLGNIKEEGEGEEVPKNPLQENSPSGTGDVQLNDIA
jgi:hypothetical protein